MYVCMSVKDFYNYVQIARVHYEQYTIQTYQYVLMTYLWIIAWTDQN